MGERIQILVVLVGDVSRALFEVERRTVSELALVFWKAYISVSQSNRLEANSVFVLFLPNFS